MSFPLGTMRGEATALPPGQAPVVPWRRKAWLFIGGVAWLLFLLAMLTHDPNDAAFTTSGNGEPLHNRVGVVGARVADLAYFFFGFSAWWLLPVGLRASHEVSIIDGASRPCLPRCLPGSRHASHGPALASRWCAGVRLHGGNRKSSSKGYREPSRTWLTGSQ